MSSLEKKEWKNKVKLITGEGQPWMTSIVSSMKMTRVKEQIYLRVPHVIWLIIYLHYLIYNATSYISNRSATSFFCLNLLTSRNYHWHSFLTCWHLASEILHIKQPQQTALLNKVVHNFCQGSREGILEQPAGVEKHTVYCLVFLSVYASFLWFLVFLSKVSSVIH